MTAAASTYVPGSDPIPITLSHSNPDMTFVGILMYFQNAAGAKQGHWSTNQDTKEVCGSITHASSITKRLPYTFYWNPPGSANGALQLQAILLSGEQRVTAKQEFFSLDGQLALSHFSTPPSTPSTPTVPVPVPTPAETLPPTDNENSNGDPSAEDTETPPLSSQPCPGKSVRNCAGSQTCENDLSRCSACSYGYLLVKGTDSSDRCDSSVTLACSATAGCNQVGNFYEIDVPPLGGKDFNVVSSFTYTSYLDPPAISSIRIEGPESLSLSSPVTVCLDVEGPRQLRRGPSSVSNGEGEKFVIQYTSDEGKNWFSLSNMVYSEGSVCGDAVEFGIFATRKAEVATRPPIAYYPNPNTPVQDVQSGANIATVPGLVLVFLSLLAH